MTSGPDLSERLLAPISTAELQRRWTAVRREMELQGIDVLLVQGHDDFQGGYIRYFTDVPAIGGNAVSLLFPRDDAMTMITHGPPGDRAVAPDGDGILRGVKRVLTNGSWSSVWYTGLADLDLLLKALEPYKKARIGLLGQFRAPGNRGVQFWNALSDATLVDAFDLVDRIKAVKSPEEQQLIRRTAALQDAAMEAAVEAIEPGKTEGEIVAVAQHIAHQQGCEQGFFFSSSGGTGEPLRLGPRHLQNRVVQRGDTIAFLLETNGPGGLYTHLGRMVVLGKAPEPMLEEFDFALRVQHYTVNLLQPGVAPAAVWEAYNTFMRENGRPEETRLHCHGQGYDAVERPLVRFDEAMTIEAGMNMGCHPSYAASSGPMWFVDNFLIAETGHPERLHSFPQEVIQLDA